MKVVIKVVWLQRLRPNNGMHPTRISVPPMQGLSLATLCAGG